MCVGYGLYVVVFVFGNWVVVIGIYLCLVGVVVWIVEVVGVFVVVLVECVEEVEFGCLFEW